MITAVVVLGVLAVLCGALVLAGRWGWRQVGGKLTRELQLQIAQETATSGPQAAVTAWRRTLDNEVAQTKRALQASQQSGASVADFDNLVHLLERAARDLDSELAVLGRERDPAVVDHRLRLDVGTRAQEVATTAARLREAMARSRSTGSRAALRDLTESTHLSVTALSSALDELEDRAYDPYDVGLDAAPNTLPETRPGLAGPPQGSESPVTTDAELLTCPKCHAQMRRYERNGVVIDQCSECRGIFLDAGELEQLMRAENAHYQQPAPQQGYQQPPQGYPQGGYQQGGGFLNDFFGGGHHRRGHH